MVSNQEGDNMESMKLKWPSRATLSILLLIFSTVLYAEGSPSMKLGTIEVKLGTPKKEVIAQLSEVYDLSQDEDPNHLLNVESWTVYEKGETLLQTVGGIGFKNEKLDFASREVAHLTEDSRADELANALFSILTELESTQTKYTIRTSSKYGPKYKSILLYSADGKTLVIGIVKGEGVETAVTVEKSIGWSEPTF